MTARAALLHAIRLNPAEDLPRLVYADHLEDAGESERAEFIRVGIAVSHRPEGEYCNRFHDYQACDCVHCREAQLEQRHGTFAIEGVRTIWSRGFIVEIRAPLADLLEHGPAIVAEHPVERVRVTDREPMPSSTGDATWFYTALGIGGELIDRMCGQPPQMFAWFGSPAEAHAALNAAVLANVREKAGETC